MAKSVPMEAMPVRAEERTWRTNVETPAGQPWSIQFYRETVHYDGSDNIVTVAPSMAPVNRQLDAVADEQVILEDGTEITVAQVIEALSLFADNWPVETVPPPPMPEPQKE
jgi:hypothetical protein